MRLMFNLYCKSTKQRIKKLLQFDYKFTKRQFDHLIWPNANFTCITAGWCAFLIGILMAALVYAFDPIAIKMVMMLS